MEQDQCKCELKQMRDLCMKLDKEKDTLKSELRNRDDRRTQVILNTITNFKKNMVLYEIRFKIYARNCLRKRIFWRNKWNVKNLAWKLWKNY